MTGGRTGGIPVVPAVVMQRRRRRCRRRRRRRCRRRITPRRHECDTRACARDYGSQRVHRVRASSPKILFFVE